MKLSVHAKVGLITIIAAITLAGMIIWKGDLFIKVGGYEVIGSFNDVGGLIVGSEVRYRGYKVGKIAGIYPNPVNVKVYLTVNSDIKIPEDSRLRIAFDGLIGQKYVEILPSKNENLMKPGTILIGYNTLGIVDFIDIGTRNLEESKKILESVSKITDDPIIQKAAKDILINIKSTSNELNKIVSGFSRALEKGGVDELVRSLSKASDSIGRVSERLDTLVGGVEKLTTDPQFLADIKESAKKCKRCFL